MDTNVFISGIHWSGSSESVLRAWFSNVFTHISSQKIIDEIVRTLTSFKISLDNDQIRWWENLITDKSQLVSPRRTIRLVVADPDDDKFIEAGIEGNADYIVTQDKHLLNIKKFETIQIVTPKEFLLILNSS